MKKLALLLTILVVFAQGAMATVSITVAGNPCPLPATLYFSANSDSLGSGFGMSWMWSINGNMLLTPMPTWTFNAPGVYTVTAYLSDMNGNSDEGTIQVVVTNDCASLATISGHVYNDQNSNCLIDAGESGPSGTTIHVQSQGGAIDFYASTDVSGQYQLSLPGDSTYTITPELPAGTVATCPGSAILTLSAGGATTADFGYHCPGSATDDYAITGTFGEFTATSNVSCPGTMATVVMTYDTGLVITCESILVDGNNVSPDSVVGQSRYYTLHNFTSVNCNPFCVGVDTSLVQVGDTLCVTVTLSSALSEADLSNNTYTLCFPYTGPYDPNNKEVTPKGTGPEGYIPDTTTKLTYRINFQNTGTDTATSVVLRDTLHANLIPSTISIIGSSHPVLLAQDGNALAFSFPGIQLPDSNADAPASHGYVLYSVDLVDSLQPGAAITNKASIYFDSNEPVATNTTLNTIALQAPTSVQPARNATASIYPNPANDWLNISAQDFQSAVLTDASGRTLRTASGPGNLRIDVRNLPEGLYWIKLSGAKGTVVRKVAVAH